MENLLTILSANFEACARSPRQNIENTTVDKAPPASGLPDLKVKKSKANGMGNLTNQVMITVLRILHCSQMGFCANRVVLLGIA